jgi:hypothetical protein
VEQTKVEKTAHSSRKRSSAGGTRQRLAEPQRASVAR